MRLSTAIRLGAMLKGQAFRTVYDRHAGAMCALGAALDAIGELEPYMRDELGFHDVWPGVPDHIATRITVLNDLNGWTREEIADEVEQWEATAPPGASESQSLQTSVDVSADQGCGKALVDAVAV